MDLDILAFGAHADDVELACGGTLALCASRGQRVGIVDLTRGEMATRGTPEKRLVESEASRVILGAVDRVCLDLGDGGLRTGREEELEVIEVVRSRRPSVVLAPLPDERHTDHVRAGRLVTDAAFYAGLRRIETASASHRPQAVIYYLGNYPRDPSFVVDVTSTWEAKMKAIAAYRSQFHDPESNEPETFISRPDFLAAIEASGRFYGAMIGGGFGEAFVTRLPPRIVDLVAAYSGREVGGST